MKRMMFLGLGLALAGCTAAGNKPMMARVSQPTLMQQVGYEPTTPEMMKEVQFDTTFAGMPLVLDGFEPTFEDNFSRMSVTDGEGKGPWYSPVHASFGGGKFVGPREGKGPVLVRDGKLVIQLSKEDGKWVSSLVQTVNKNGQGFAQQYGYFEARMKLSDEKGAWGGLWLHSHPNLSSANSTQTEIDVAELYGGGDYGIHSSLHLWPAKEALPGHITGHVGKSGYAKNADLFKDFHTYGVMLTPDEMVFYYDRQEIYRTPMLPEYKVPQYVLLDIALLEKQWRHAKGTMELEVDYVKVWQKKGGW